MKTILFFLLLLFAVGSVDAATTYYADQSCGNVSTYVPATRACTGGTATVRTTIAGGKALLSSPGDILYIRTGVWLEPILTLTVSGSSGNPITIAGYPGDTLPIIRPANNSASGIEINAAWVDVKDLRVDGQNLGPTHNVTTGDSSNQVRFINLELYDNGKNFPNRSPGSGAKPGGSNISFINCVIHHNGAYNNPYNFDGSQAPYGFYWSATTGGLIEGSTIHSNGAQGIQVVPANNGLIIRNNIWHSNGGHWWSTSGTVATGGQMHINGSNIQIYNNLFYNGNAVNSVGMSLFTCSSCTVRNNTIYDQQDWGMNIDNVTNSTVTNNIVSTNDANIILGGATTGTTRSNNLCSTAGGTGNCNITESAATTFIDTVNANFRLKAGSAAIDGGAATCPATDIEGTVRPQNGVCDVGAYELGSTPPPSPAKVLELMLTEGTGNPQDSSGNANHVTSLGSGVTWTTTNCRTSPCLSFTGVGAMTVADSNSLDLTHGYTLMAWIRPSTTPSNQFSGIIHKNIASYRMYSSAETVLCANSGPLSGYSLTTGDTFVCYATPFTVNTWTHYAVTYDQPTGVLSVWINGSQVTTRVGGAIMEATSGTLTIGGTVFGEFYNGLINGGIRVYNHARTQAQIQADMALPAPTFGPNAVDIKQNITSKKVGPSVTLKHGLAP